MRTLAPLALAFLASLAGAAPAAAQVSDAERAAARDLFVQGDELQRTGRFAEALDKFQRAQQAFSAPTNRLHIAECEAALGRLVESTESYRAVLRTPLPAGASPAFHAAVEQARGELAQVEPRVPAVIIQVAPASVPDAQMQIDGQAVPIALVGEPISLDPGAHRVVLSAPGYARVDEAVQLAEREHRVVPLTLHPLVGGAPQPPPPPAHSSSAGSAGAAGPTPTSTPATAVPPSPPALEEAAAPRKRESRTSLLFGLHGGAYFPVGTIPLQGTQGASSDVSAHYVSGAGLAYGLDLGIRFAREWFLGLTVEHAELGQGDDPSQIQQGVTSASSDTTLAAVSIGLIANPDVTSFFAQLGLAERWYDLTYSGPDGPVTNQYNSSDLLLRLGIWIPIGRVVRLLPSATVTAGVFDNPGASSSSASGSANATDSQVHAYFMLGLGGFYNVDL